MHKSGSRSQKQFFKTTIVPGKAGGGKLFERKLVVADDVSAGSAKPGPIWCLGMTFESEDARRAYFLERLKAELPELRKRPDFPTAEDEEILRISDPPYYTACPNPFVGDFINQYGKRFDPATDDYHRKPFASDVREGKNHPIYNAHSYHTKVPHKAIMRYVLHFTDPGDVVFDGFCGTGMTGVAAALCESTSPDTDLNSIGASKNGQRYAILSDLSPIATFIASNLLRPIHRTDFSKAVEELCSDIDNEFGHLYLTNHSGWRVRDRKNVKHKHYQRRCDQKGNVEFTLYSDVVRCPECVSETTLYNLAVDEQNDSLRSNPKCPYCNALVQKSKWERAYTTNFDPVLKQTVRQLRIEPVLINYTVGATRYEKLPDDHDKQLINTASNPHFSSGKQ